MCQLPSPEEYESPWPELDQGLSAASDEQLSIYDLIDELANSMGIWGPEDNVDGGRRARSRRRRSG